MSHVKVSPFEMPIYAGEADGIGVLNLLEAIKVMALQIKQDSLCIYELYKVQVPQKKQLLLSRSSYGVAKLYGYWIVKLP